MVGTKKDCYLCNPYKLDGNPEISTHLSNKVMSFPNAAPFLPGDQKVLFLPEHHVEFAEFGNNEFYYLTLAASEMATDFPNTKSGKNLQEDINPIRCIAGFNIGKFAGQSIPHFHLQYGWEIVVNPKMIDRPLLNCYYSEMREENLIIYEDDDIYLIIPWTPKGQYHIEIHFKHLHEFGQLKKQDIYKLTCFTKRIHELYRNEGIENLNIVFTGSPHEKHWEPLRVQFIPRVNVFAFYEMAGVIVIDTPIHIIESFFTSTTRWSDVAKQSLNLDEEG
jgi:diadenosine tetraphosphate (Ap4A) HIT family hydrolase